MRRLALKGLALALAVLSATGPALANAGKKAAAPPAQVSRPGKISTPRAPRPEPFPSSKSIKGPISRVQLQKAVQEMAEPPVSQGAEAPLAPAVASAIRVIQINGEPTQELDWVYDLGRAGDKKIGPDPAAVRAAEENLRGKALLVVGGSFPGRPWLEEDPVMVARKLGMRLVVVGEHKNRPSPGAVAAENFIEAPVMEHDAATVSRMVGQVSDFVRKNSLNVAGVATFLNPYVELTALIRDEMRKTVNPAILGDSYTAVHAANEKFRARELLAAKAPEVSTPHAVISSPEEARKAFLKLTAGRPGRRVVVKPITSAGKIGIKLNISTPDEAAAAFIEVDAALRKASKEEFAKFHSVDTYSGVMMELQMEGPEVDVEIVRGLWGGFGVVIGNPKATNEQEKGFSFPSQLPDAIQNGLILGALKGLDAVGLSYGNSHTEMMHTPDGARIIEFNPRMGGSRVYPLAKMVYGVSLVEQGLRALLGLPVVAPTEQRYPLVVMRDILPQFSGKVRAIEGAEGLDRLPGVLEAQMIKKAGMSQIAPQDGYADDVIGYVTATGRHYAEALENTLRALRRVTITVEQRDGTVARQSGAYTHADRDELEVMPPLAGKRLLLLGHKKERQFLLERPVEWARQNGVELFLADHPDRREASRQLIPDSHFIAADIDSHDPAVMDAEVEKIASAAQKKGLAADDRVYSLLNPYVELVGKLVDRLGVFGNSFASASAGHTKARARELWAQDPELALPYEVVNAEAPANDDERPAHEEKVRRAFRRIAASGKSGKVVLKPVHGAGSALVEGSIDSEEKAVAAWRKIDAGLRDPNLPGRKFFMLDHYPGIMMEYQAEGVEVDVEGIRSPDGRPELQIMGDNAPMDDPHRVEKNFALPSQLPEPIQEEGKRIARKALDALGYKVGNSHVEMIYSPADKRWYLVEANLRMGGIMIEPLVKEWAGFSLIEEGLNSLFGLALPDNTRPASTIETRLIIPRESGKIVAIEGLDQADSMPGVFRVDKLKSVGDEIKAAPEHASDYFAAVSVKADSYRKAMSLVLKALSSIRYTVRTQDGRLVEHTGDYSHVPVDVNTLLADDGKP